MLAPIGIIMIPIEAKINFLDFKSENDNSWLSYLPGILGKNIIIKSNVKKLNAKIQNIAGWYPNTVPKAVVIGSPTMLPTDIPSNILVI